MRVQEEGEDGEGEGEEEVGEGEKLERKGRREKEGRTETRGWEGVEAFPLSFPSRMMKCVPCVCLFMRMLTLYNVVKF